MKSHRVPDSFRSVFAAAVTQMNMSLSIYMYQNLSEQGDQLDLAIQLNRPPTPVLNDSCHEHPFIAAANAFCGLIEQFDSHHRSEWLDQIANTLLGLEATITDLHAPFPPSPHGGLSDLEKRFELYSRLKKFLRDNDEYWSEADLHAGDGYMTGSLSDDFADIYFELKHGLLLHEQGGHHAKTALQFWTDGFRDHWHQHLVDARKQLFDFRMRP